MQKLDGKKAVDYACKKSLRMGMSILLPPPHELFTWKDAFKIDMLTINKNKTELDVIKKYLTFDKDLTLEDTLFLLKLKQQYEKE